MPDIFSEKILLELLVSIPAAVAVIVVTFGFLKYIRARDRGESLERQRYQEQGERMEKFCHQQIKHVVDTNAVAIREMTEAIHGLKVAISQVKRVK